MSRARRAGFSLVEALVALTIAALVLGAVFQLQVQMARGQQRAAQAVAQVSAQENALALVRDINPMARPTGEIALADGDTIRWQATPRGAAIRNAGFPTGNGQFDVQMFSITVTVERARGANPGPLVFDRVGWRRVDDVF